MFPIHTYAIYPNNGADKTADGSSHTSARRRSRGWERQHREEKVVYRGLDPRFVLEVQRLASGLLVPQGEVARTILEYSLRRYEEGFLELVPRPDPTRMRRTLHSSPPNSRKQPMKRKSKKSPSWRDITTWRNFSPELKRTISALASEEALNVPVGELVNALLHYGLQAHHAGLLKLETVLRESEA